MTNPPTSDRLPKNMTYGPSIGVLSKQKNPNTGSGAAGYISSGKIFSFFNSKDSRPSNILFQIARGLGATLSECPYSPKKRTSQKNFFKKRPLQGFSSEEAESSLFHPARPERTRRLLSSTMKCSGACRCRIHRVPH
jgi:hypothetical protein